jgi:uncharacterized delta-60 repeat protein
MVDGSPADEAAPQARASAALATAVCVVAVVVGAVAVPAEGQVTRTGSQLSETRRPVDAFDAGPIAGAALVAAADMLRPNNFAVSSSCAVEPDPAAGALEFSTTNLTVAEGAGDRLVLVIRTGGSAGAVGATARTADGSASAGQDYTPVAADVGLPHGDATVRVVRVSIVQDIVNEPDETLTLTLTDPSCATVGAKSTVTITILDDDPDPDFTIGGTVAGLTGGGVLLRNNFDDEISPVDGSFVFPQRVSVGRGYDVTVVAQPVDPDQICTVQYGTGRVVDADVTDVSVLCTTPPASSHLDPTFGIDGKVSTAGVPGAEAVVIQPDGKIVVAGEFSLSRYQADGTPDPEFGTNGTVRTGLSAGFLDDASDAALQLDGSIVVVGIVKSTVTGEDFGVQRFDSAGILDPDFGIGGTVTTDFDGGTDRGYGVVIQPDNKLLVAGQVTISGNSDIGVARYTDAGLLDNSFDGDGRVTTDIAGATDFGHAIALQADDRIVVVGRSVDDSAAADSFAVVRYTPDGITDPSLGDDGIVIADFGGGAIAHGVAIDAGRNVVVAGSASSGFSTGRQDFAVARFDPSGRLDPTFDGDGLITMDFADTVGPLSQDEFGKELAIQPDGRIVVVGVAQFDRGADLAVTRLEPMGGVDTTFGINGRLTVDFHGGFDSGHDVVIQADGGIVAIGSAVNVFTVGIALLRVIP